MKKAFKLIIIVLAASLVVGSIVFFTRGLNLNSTPASIDISAPPETDEVMAAAEKALPEIFEPLIPLYPGEDLSLEEAKLIRAYPVYVFKPLKVGESIKTDTDVLDHLYRTDRWRVVLDLGNGRQTTITISKKENGEWRATGAGERELPYLKKALEALGMGDFFEAGSQYEGGEIYFLGAFGALFPHPDSFYPFPDILIAYTPEGLKAVKLDDETKEGRAVIYSAVDLINKAIEFKKNYHRS